MQLKRFHRSGGDRWIHAVAKAIDLIPPAQSLPISTLLSLADACATSRSTRRRHPVGQPDPEDPMNTRPVSKIERGAQLQKAAQNEPLIGYQLLLDGCLGAVTQDATRIL